MEDKRARFLRAYTRVPPTLRKEIIVVIDDKPYTWETVFFEVRNNIDKQLIEKILNTLINLQII